MLVAVDHYRFGFEKQHEGKHQNEEHRKEGEYGVSHTEMAAVTNIPLFLAGLTGRRVTGSLAGPGSLHAFIIISHL